MFFTCMLKSLFLDLFWFFPSLACFHWFPYFGGGRGFGGMGVDFYEFFSLDFWGFWPRSWPRSSSSSLPSLPATAARFQRLSGCLQVRDLKHGHKALGFSKLDLHLGLIIVRALYIDVWTLPETKKKHDIFVFFQSKSKHETLHLCNPSTPTHPTPTQRSVENHKTHLCGERCTWCTLLMSPAVSWGSYLKNQQPSILLLGEFESYGSTYFGTNQTGETKRGSRILKITGFKWNLDNAEERGILRIF